MVVTVFFISGKEKALYLSADLIFLLYYLILNVRFSIETEYKHKEKFVNRTAM